MTWLQRIPGADGDVFNLEIPAGVLVLNAGAEVMKAFNSSVTADIDFAGGDDIVDGADVTRQVSVQQVQTVKLTLLLVQLSPHTVCYNN